MEGFSYERQQTKEFVGIVVTTLRWYDVTVPRIQSPTSFSLPTLFLKIDVDVKNVSGM